MDFEVHLSVGNATQLIGLARSSLVRGKETVQFEYADEWLKSAGRFALEPLLPLTRGIFYPPAGLGIHGSLGDSAPDSWGRKLMQRAERNSADREGRSVRTLMSSDYLLGVSDVSRMGALRYRLAGGDVFLAASTSGVPPLIKLGDLLRSADRILRNEETDEDLHHLIGPGSSLGGARPKASVIDQHGHLSIAKFAKETDEYSIETWEEIGLLLARAAGICVADHQLLTIAGRSVLLSRRFDRLGQQRIPFLSAMTMLNGRDGTTGSYPEIVDALSQYGANAKQNTHELYRRVAFNVLVSNVDDHLRNHGFLRLDRTGWVLSPAYDINPTPTDVKARVLATNIDLEEATCSIELLESAAQYFALSLDKARSIIADVATVTSTWRTVAERLRVRPTEIDRMSSAFEHDDLRRARSIA